MADATIRERVMAPAVFGEVYGPLSRDARCAAAAARIRSHSVEVACMARELSFLADADPAAAFAAGLLHDIGELLLMHRDRVGYLDLLSAATVHSQQVGYEKARYRTDHPLLGAEFVLDERLPDSVAGAVADHHDPHRFSSPTTIVVAAADELLSGDPERRHAVDLLGIYDSHVEPQGS